MERIKVCGNCKLCDFESEEAQDKASEVVGNSFVRAVTRLFDPKDGDSLEGLEAAFDESLKILFEAAHPVGIRRCSGREGTIARSDEVCVNKLQWVYKEKTS